VDIRRKKRVHKKYCAITNQWCQGSDRSKHLGWCPIPTFLITFSSLLLQLLGPRSAALLVPPARAAFWKALSVFLENVIPVHQSASFAQKKDNYYHYYYTQHGWCIPGWCIPKSFLLLLLLALFLLLKDVPGIRVILANSKQSLVEQPKQRRCLPPLLPH
jgi:hypothetical protein